MQDVFVVAATLTVPSAVNLITFKYALPVPVHEMNGVRIRIKQAPIVMFINFFNVKTSRLGWKSSFSSIQLRSLMGQLHRDFRPSVFFHQSIPPRAPIHGLKPFRIWLRTRRDNRFGSRQNRFQRGQ
jgi:hypothetical protein